MATLLETYNRKNEAQTLRNRLEAAIAKTAYYILTTEPPETPNHTARLAWAVYALQEGKSREQAELFMWPALQNVDIMAQGDAIDDTTIQYVVDILINPFALASYQG